MGQRHAPVTTGSGRSVLEVGPFRPTVPVEGDALQRPHGSVLRSDDPFVPVPEDEWAALA
jgi:hypothetical protein